MGIGNRTVSLRSVFGKNLKDDATRARAIEKAIEQATEAYRKGSASDGREAILRLQDEFDEAGLDRMELLSAADSSLGSDSFWLREIVEILLRRPRLTEAEISYLQRLASLEPARLSLWRRIIREREGADNAPLLAQAAEQAATGLLRFFGPTRNQPWPEPSSEAEAKEFLFRVLRQAVDTIIESGREDAAAQALLRGSLPLLADNSGGRRHLARIIVRSGQRTPENLAIVLESLMDDPADRELRLWAGTALADTPGHQEEGLQVLRQLCEDRPNDRKARTALVSAVKGLEELSDEDAPMLRAHFAENRDDRRAAELLASYCAQRNDLSDEALRLYRMAAASSPNRNLYLRMLGEASASRCDWPKVIEIFSEVREKGEATEEIIIPLATAYAESRQADAESIAVYRQAIDLGMRNPAVHDLYCRHLYQTARRAPESVAQFLSTTKDCPECLWAKLGLAAHYLDTRDARRALETALGLLALHENDQEALALAAEALAADFSRGQLARLAHLSPALLRKIFEKAHGLAPDSGPIALGLVRRRMEDGVKDAETLRLLGDVCRKNPDAMDLRVARADMMWDLGQQENAAALYRELIERWRLRTGAEARGIDPAARGRALYRVAESTLARPAGPAFEDMETLIEACGEPQLPTEMQLRIARALIDLNFDHPARLPLLQRALEIAPGDLKIERALAEAHAARGSITPALRLAIRLLREARSSDETTDLLRSVRVLLGTSTVDGAMIEQLRAALDPEKHSPPLLLAASEVIAEVSGAVAEDLPVLESLRTQFPRNVRVQRRHAEALAAANRHEEAAEVFQNLLRESREDDDLVLQMAMTNARLGRRDRQHLRTAQRAVELRPDDPDLLLHLAAILLDSGQTLPAVEKLDWLLENYPGAAPRVQALLEQFRTLTTEDGALLLVQARVHIKSGRVDQAIATLARLQGNYQRHFGELLNCYSELTDVAPDNPRPYVDRAILYRLSGRIDEAIEDLATAHVLAPDNSDILSEFADTLAQKIKHFGNYTADTAVQCGEMYTRLGEDDAAFEMAEIALAAESNNPDALSLLARLQLNTGDLHNGWATMRRAPLDLEMLPMLQELARAFSEDEEHDLAADVLTAAMEVAGPQRELLEQLRALYKEQARSTAGASQRQKIYGALSEKARGRYELREHIATGAMGIVYKAYDRELDEIVVLKVLPEHFGRDPEALALFRNEAKAARKLAHPHICRIHDIGEEDGRKHISMEYVPGGDLRTLLKNHPGGLTPEEAIRIAREAARALGHAHGEGVLHRDIKAANILLTSSGRVKLSDFGIAALTEAASNMMTGAEAASTVVGTPIYMSPEQFEFVRLTPASDLYSLGILFYEMLSGAPPFTRGSISYHHRFTEPAPLTNIDPALWQIVAKLLKKNARERYQNAAQFLTALDEYENRR